MPNYLHMFSGFPSTIELSSCNRNHVVPSLKIYLLSGPLQKRFAGPSSKFNFKFQNLGREKGFSTTNMYFIVMTHLS